MPVELGSIAAQHGPWVALVALLAWMLWRFTERTIARLEEQADKRDEAHRLDRAAERQAHIAALNAIAERVQGNTHAIESLTSEVRELGVPPRRRGG